MDIFALKLIKNGQTTVSNYLLSNFPKLNMTPAELVIYLQIKRFSDEGIRMPHVKMLTQSTGYSRNQIYEILHKMIQKKLMTIKTVYDQNKHQLDEYNFSLMDKKLSQLSHSRYDDNDNWKLNNLKWSKGDNSITASGRERVFKTIEEEFGRGLSQIESETVSGWMAKDHYSPKMIILALKEAVLSQVYNLRYISKILDSWERRNIRTPEALQNYKNKRSAYGSGQSRPSDINPKKGPHIPIFKL